MVSNKKTVTFFNNKWRAVELIGEGSYGRVYKAKKEEFGIESYSAIKQIELPYSKSEINVLKTEGMTEVDIGKYYENSVKKWIEEIDIMLIPEFKECENIVNIEDYEVVKKKDGIGWTINIRMELLTSLDKYELEKTLTDKDILKIGIDIASALEICEEKDVIHRDIKPENIFVNGRGVYKLGDFGVAKHTNKTLSNMSKKGTENYMAPELYQNKRGSKTVDIYSLGIMLYKYFNYNRLPFLPDYPNLITAEDRENAIYKRIGGEEKMAPPKNATTREISEIILKACNYYSKDRYESAKELKKALLEEYNKIKEPKVIIDFKEIIKENEEQGNVSSGTVGILPQIDMEEEENLSIADEYIPMEKEKSKIDDVIIPKNNIKNEERKEKKQTPKLKVFLIVLISILALVGIGIGIAIILYLKLTVDPSRENPFDMYGKYVNYECDDSNVKWRLFYTDTQNAYLVSNKNIGENKNLKDTSTDYIGAENITNSQVVKYFEWVCEFKDSTSNNIKSVAYMTDTSKWEDYCNSQYAKYATGGSTIDMLTASYNKVHDNKLLYKLSQNGYKVKIDGQTEYEEAKLNLNDLIYDFNKKTQFEDLYNYEDEVAWIAGPSGNSEDSVYNLGDKLNYTSTYEDTAGFRPVVCLKEGVRFRENEDGTYDIIYSEGSFLHKVFDFVMNHLNKKSNTNERQNGIANEEGANSEESEKANENTFSETLEELSFNIPNKFTADYAWAYSTQDGEDGFVYVTGDENLSYWVHIDCAKASVDFDLILDSYTKVFENISYNHTYSEKHTETINGNDWTTLDVEAVYKPNQWTSTSSNKQFWYYIEHNGKLYYIEFMIYGDSNAKWHEDFDIIKKSMKFN